jgi:hypothetical protein
VAGEGSAGFSRSEFGRLGFRQRQLGMLVTPDSRLSWRESFCRPHNETHAQMVFALGNNL